MTQPDLTIVREMFDLTGARWTVPVLVALETGRMRFGEIARDVGGVAQKQLAATLKDLERDGFVLRTAFATIPPRVEYELTELGEELVGGVKQLGAIAFHNRERIATARREFAARAAV
ncbi:MAG: helix-turn-helix transcriptional regulator [Devosia sp.]|jgi:DNA-binding HxlR family transcriptional regulator|nr:helix-turn-helix transcriptional regulator [Devosia sp.]